MDCIKCGKELEPEGNYFITETRGPDYLWYCSCGQGYEVEHYCEVDGCVEWVYPVEVN